MCDNPPKTNNLDVVDKSNMSLSSQLVQLVNSLYLKETYSDLMIIVKDKSYQSHKFVIHSRSNFWFDLNSKNCIELPEVPHVVFDIVFKWIYTDEFDLSIKDDLLLKVAEVAHNFNFFSLRQLCETLLISRIVVENCALFFTFANKEDFTNLRVKCSEFVSSRWNEFGIEHFASLSGTLLYQLLKGHSSNVLRSIVELAREDVLFLYYNDNQTQFKSIVNDTSVTESVLEIALTRGNFEMANQLIEKGANIDLFFTNSNSSIINRLVAQENFSACEFLKGKGVSFKALNNGSLSPLQIICQNNISDQMLIFALSIVELSDLDYVSSNTDYCRRTALHFACLNPSNTVNPLISAILDHKIELNLLDSDGKSALFYALCSTRKLEIADKLIENGADIDALFDGNPLVFHTLATIDSFKLLVKAGPKLGVKNKEQVPLLHHVIRSLSIEGLEQISLISSLSDVNITDHLSNTPLHLAVDTHLSIVKGICDNNKEIDWKIRNNKGNTALATALEGRKFDFASTLLSYGAPIDEVNEKGEPLILEALNNNHDDIAVFLLTNKANHNIRDSAGCSCLELALSGGLTQAVKALCGAGVNVNERSVGGNGFSVIERALTAGHFDAAELLVSFGCDMESWTKADGCDQTLLHHLMDVGSEDAAVFLIEHGCDINARKKYDNSSDDDGQYPIHMAVSWNLNKVLSAILQRDVKFDLLDNENRTACHIAIREANFEALSLLLNASDLGFLSVRDRVGQTPLSLALARRDFQSAGLIVQRQPHSVLQINGNGENLLHISSRSNDLESVLFLLGTQMDPTKTTQDSIRKTALHLSVNSENELIMRNLILAGCVVDARSSDGSTPLHDAVRAHRADLVNILIDNGANLNIVDENGETVLLTAVRNGSYACVKSLLALGHVDLRHFNKFGQSILHICASLGANKIEDSRSQGDLCEMLIQSATSRLSEKDLAMFIEAKDLDGNTALLIAYIRGNAGVCRCLLRRNASMGAQNHQGITVFSHETPTKQLLFGLLETLESEPRWSEGDACDCGAKFSITLRKHHCRHCGRVVCSTCSPTSMPIVKFGEEKKVRICNLCALVLTQGAPRS